MSLRKDPTRMMIIHRPEQIDVKLQRFQELVEQSAADDMCPLVITVQRLSQLGREGNHSLLKRVERLLEEKEGE